MNWSKTHPVCCLHVLFYFHVVFFLFLCVHLGAFFLFTLFATKPPLWMGIIAAVFMCGLIGSLQHWINRTRRLVKANQFLCCESCLHPLYDLPTLGLCPECGTPYEHVQLQHRWRLFCLGRKKTEQFERLLPVEPRRSPPSTTMPVHRPNDADPAHAKTS